METVQVSGSLSHDQFIDAIFAGRPDAISNTEEPLKTIPENHYIRDVLGVDLDQRMKNAKVLMVGAGGIGCELLKNLLLSNFEDIVVVDLDTIDLSNLNRQFLFRHEHIKMPKAIVAKRAAHKFNTEANMTAHHGNIKDPEFGLEWFSQFVLVFNALDNLDARRYVNKMCLSANIPLIESGTTGFKGQVQVIKKGFTACYDCSPKETPKTFPVCTIRSTPSQPIHCIVWAKSYLLNEIFGASEDESAFDHSEDAANAAEIEELWRESQALKEIRGVVTEPSGVGKLFDKVFNKDINRLLAVEEMWKGKRKPVPILYDHVKDKAEPLQENILEDNGQNIWSLEQNVAMLMASMKKLGHRVKAMRISDPHEPATISFDKDDEDTLNFVTAAANIRATIFGIVRKSRFDVKQMAGNIIPAIATTNAITAGLVVLQAYQILQNRWNNTKEVYLTPFAPDRLLAPDRPRLPNKDCPICTPVTLMIKADDEKSTLGHLVEFLKEKVGYTDDFAISLENGLLFDADEDENLLKLLKDVGVENQRLLTVVDEADEDPKVNVVLSIQYIRSDTHDIGLLRNGDSIPTIPLKRTPPSPPPPTLAANDGADDDDDDDDIVVASDGPSSGVKRPHVDDDDTVEAVEPKKARKDETGDVETSKDMTTVVEDENGAILIED